MKIKYFAWIRELTKNNEEYLDSNEIQNFKELKKISNQKNLDFDIEIDGGINFDNNKLAIEAGANILVSGTTIFKNNNGNIKKNRKRKRVTRQNN